MATVETGLMLSQHSDYMIASEETEPGVGWYYTNWLTELGKNPSLPTTQLGKQICDDFVSACATSARGQSTTLSLVDLAELSHTVPSTLTSFSKSISSLVTNKEYKTVSDARNLSREFAPSTRIDQVDLIDLCTRMDTAESKALASALNGAIKYNRSGSMTNAYGLSVYFPYRKLSNVDKALSTYRQLGMDETYSAAIRDFASVELSGQHSTSYPSNPLESIFSAASMQPAQSSSSQDMISDLLGAFLGGGSSSLSGLDFFSGRSLSNETLTSFVQANHLDPARLVFVSQENGDQTLTLAPEEWAQITGAEQNVFFDDGSGYIDLGLDNVYSFDSEGRMIATADGAWITVNGQFVAYYHESTEDDGEHWANHGRIPVLFNGEPANLLVTFDEEHPSGAITGVRFEYTDETDTVAKSVIDLEEGDLIQFLCDYYTYDKEYQSSHIIGEPLTWNADVTMSASYIEDPSKVLLTYMFTDIYQNEYWTGPLAIRR